jgi:myo-inositol-1(or 4)-monophosphatase
VTWVVDPIDGTVNYAYGIPQYAVSIAAVTGRRRPRRGRDRRRRSTAPPSTSSSTRTAAGGLARRSALRVSTVTDAGALLATGFGYDPATTTATWHACAG